jgi:hypothetical protein
MARCGKVPKVPIVSQLATETFETYFAIVEYWVITLF